MNRKILLGMLGFSVFFFIVSYTVGLQQFFRIRGFFDPLDTWTLGHPGRVTFDIGNANSGASSNVDVDGYLSGSFWLGNVGWGSFNYTGATGVERARILCSDDVFRNPGMTCPVTGYAWSQNAGWIILSGSLIDGGSGVYYNPATAHMEGFGFNAALGWVPFYADAATPITTVVQTGITLDGIGVNFIGKIAIIGNISGTRIYNITNQNVGYIFGISNHSEVLNTIRRNVSLISRNVPSVDLANRSSPKVNFLLYTDGSDYDTSIPGWVWQWEKRSIIVVGADVILGQDTIGYDTDPDRAIIALKDATGKGGNIIIQSNVKRIYSFLYAEGSLYSGEKPPSSPIYSYVSSGAWNIPAKQLYVKGAIVSKNTIGGAMQTPSICPVIISDCTPTIAQIFDLNYFRTYDPTDITQKSAPYTDPRFSNASFIIDYNQDIVSAPPPGLDHILQ